MAGFAVASQSPVNPSSPSLSDRHSRDIPAPLSLDTPAPSSPFPSPSSSFVPPPMPGAHEFANKPPTGRFVRRKKSGSPSNSREEPASKMQDREEKAHSNAEPSNKAYDSPTHDSGSPRLPNGVPPSVNTDVQPMGSSATATPLTPTPASLAMTPTSTSTASPSAPSFASPTEPSLSASGRNTPTQTHITLPSPPSSPTQIFSSAGPASGPVRSLSGSGTASKHTSLSSSRPAPASPAPSRRQSGAPSLRSRHRSGLSTASTSFKSSPLVLPPAKRRGEIKVRDFAYPSVDARHTGRGPDTPKVIKRLLKQHGPVIGSRRASGMSESSLDSEEGSSSRRSSGFGGWGAFRWASKLGGAWGFGGAAGGSGSGSGSRASAAGGGYTPSQLDFERNFDDGADVDLVESPADADDGEYLSDYDNDGDGDGDGESEELLPGLYRALYDFDPEGTAEMGLKEGQTVRVVGRGGGVGWAIAVRPETEGEDNAAEGNWALVPESYLKIVRLDDSEPDGDDGLSLDDAGEAGDQSGS